MRALMVILSYVGFVLAAPFLLTHPKLRMGIWARFGLYRRTLSRPSSGPRVWLHGASAGDALALMPTIRELKARRDDVQVIGTTITNSGHAILEKHRSLFAAVTYLPYDLPCAVARAFKRLDPDILVLEYTELWPNLIRAANRRGVKLVLHNGRLSRARMSSYRRLFKLTGNLLERFTLLLMRDEREVDRALSLGAPEARLTLAGNTKFDSLAKPPREDVVAALRKAAAFPTGDPIWVAGSTHEGEEELLLDAFRNTRKEVAQLRMIIAPRYVERAERIACLAARRGLTCRLRTHSGPVPDVLILDTIGELVACYALATIVFVGGSFVQRGGQNILEPARCGKPVLFGPNMHNFEDAVRVLLGRGGVQVQNKEQLQRVLSDLLRRDDYRRELGDLAQAQVRAVSGAAARNAERILALLAPQPESDA